jgi:RNA recognition motif-containing protein
MPTKLYVGNLAYAVTQDDLAELFGQAGKVESAVVVSDKFSGQSRGFGFVEMVEAADAANPDSQRHRPEGTTNQD